MCPEAGVFYTQVNGRELAVKQIRINTILTIAALALTALLILTALPLASAQNAGLVGQVGRAEPPIFTGTGTLPAVGMAMWAPMAMTTDTATPTATATWTPTTAATSTATPTFTATWTPTTVATPTATPTSTPTPTASPTPCGPIEVTGGTIDTNSTWYQACSPYIVTGNVLVSEGVTLTIEPGVEVKFASGTGLQVNGTLVARGTSDSPIVFTSNQASPTAGDWISIFFADPSTDATYDANGNYTGGSILEYCEVRYGGGSGSNGAVYIEKSAPYINQCTITNSASNGVAFSQGGARISHTTISDNAQKGIYINNYPGSMETIISHSTISNNGQGGIDAYFYRGGGTFSDNIISNNTASQGGALYLSSTWWQGSTLTVQ